MSTMRLNGFLFALVCFFASFTAGTQAFAEEDIPDVCPCRDLECWRQKTNQGVADQIKCLESIADAIGPGWVKLGIAIKDLIELFNEFDIVNLLSEPGDITDAALQIKYGDSKVGILKCIKPAVSSVTDLTDAIKSFKDFDSGNSATWGTAFEGLTKIMSMFINIASALDNCTGNTEASRMAVRMNKLVADFQAGLGAVGAIANCGFRIASGFKTLVGNWSCMREDLAALRESQAALDRLRYATVSTDGVYTHPCFQVGGCFDANNQCVIPCPSGGGGGGVMTGPSGGSGDPSMCYNEPISCANAAMRALGELARRDVPWDWRTTTWCAEQCGNSTRYGGSKCSQYAGTLFASNPVCGGICNVAQCRSAQELCIAACCNLDSDCAQTAREKAGL